MYEEPRFRYTLSLDRPLRTTPTVRCIEFAISRYGKHHESIAFDPPVNEQQAVAAVEAYLSAPIDAAHYARVQGDLSAAYKALSLDEIQVRLPTRGHCLGGCTFLEALVRRGATVVIECGS